MTHIYIVPNWFFGYDILLQLGFALITLIVSIYSFKVYKLTEKRQSKLFGISFLLVSVSYLIQSFLNFIILYKLNENICIVLQIQSVNTLNLWGIYTHIFFFITGLITLVYTTLKIKSVRIYSLLYAIILVSLLLSLNKIQLFYVLSSILLLYISIHYTVTYFNTKHLTNLLVLIAFIFLLLANIQFIFSLTYGAFYVTAHALELISYILIIINLILILKK